MELKGSLNNFPLPDIIQLIGMGRRSGVLVINLNNGGEASIFFDSGEMTHATYGDLEGASVIYKLFRKQEGSFQFTSEAESPKRSITADWMTIVMEAARRFDEEEKKGREGETVMEMPEMEETGVELAETKKKMAAVLEKNFGRKSKRIKEELEKVPEEVEKLMEFCDKAEKYIYVFINNKKAREVAEELRGIIRVDQFS